MSAPPKEPLVPGRPSLMSNPRVRAIIFQALVLGAVFALLGYVFHNTVSNLEQRGISTGFGFLDREAGFGIIQSLIPYTPSSTYGRTFLVGLVNTLLVSVMGIVLATLVGLVVGIGRLSKNWLIARLAGIYIETFRNIPLLLQVLFWYFAVLQALPAPRQSLSIGEWAFLNIRGVYLPGPVPGTGFGYVVLSLLVAIVLVVWLARWAHRRQLRTGQPFHTVYASLALLVGLPALSFVLLGMPLTWSLPSLHGFNFTGGITMIPELTALLLALTIYTASSIAEIVRSGILAVSHGQTEAARSLGLNPGNTTRLVVLPQALRVIIPPLTSQYLNLVKNSSLATAIGYPDLVNVFAGTTLNQTGQAVVIIGMTMAVYLTLSLLISLFMNWYNQRVALIER
ncbi:amino acid ABC transporter permease [Acidihalobacter yilgarnensis]|uniref:Amino acid ABC transporter permease n=1 Tax=Acidihalobacter yilgarnensis TaxID=2819280 RepID=A0A1D8IRN1_9GAMM|nr:amino acid ABC transporter permease [Acidihalobacter yilgarnensis]AOU99198.1 amino acid ABC transporter permease [Acidihalobacter yilgarnensis]